MGAAKERTDLGSFLAMGAEIKDDDWHKGDIIVERHGLFHPKYLFLHTGKEIASLHWQRARTGLYVSKGVKLLLSVSSFGKTISAKDESSNISQLIVRAPLNPHKAKLVIQLADSDGFIVKQHYDEKATEKYSLNITKKHYITELINFRYNLDQHVRDRITARIYVPPIMRWEAQHFHHLIALVMGRIAFLQQYRQFRNKKNKFSSGQGTLER